MERMLGRLKAPTNSLHRHNMYSMMWETERDKGKQHSHWPLTCGPSRDNCLEGVCERAQEITCPLGKGFHCAWFSLSSLITMSSKRLLS